MSFNSRKILIVDDSLFMRNMLTSIANELGVQVVATGADGREAVELYKEHSPDLVLMDITMPYADGLYGLRGIKEINPNAYVVMCSAMGNTNMVMEAIRLGAKDFITKPFDKNRVADAVKRIQ